MTTNETTMTDEEIKAAASTRESTIKAIKAGLKARGYKGFGVTGGRGTAYGWLLIKALPARCVNYNMTEDDMCALGDALDLHHISKQGVSVPSSTAHYREYIRRAWGLSYEVAQAYWD